MVREYATVLVAEPDEVAAERRVAGADDGRVNGLRSSDEMGHR